VFLALNLACDEKNQADSGAFLQFFWLESSV